MFQDISYIVYPPPCAACGQVLNIGEKEICLTCMLSMPRTHFEEEKENPVMKLFWGKVKLEKGTAFLLFQKNGKAQNLLHQIKYKGKNEAAYEIGLRMGEELMKGNFMDGIDVMIPVPLHPKKQMKRGFNQSDWLAKGIENATGMPVHTKSLIRVHDNSTQTRKSRYSRYENVKEIFQVQKTESSHLHGKHILVIDDVITTGATLEACVVALRESVPDVKVSVAALAFAR